jgi:hypothetical protein
MGSFSAALKCKPHLLICLTLVGTEGVVSKAPLGDYALVVQAKLRGGDAWTVANVKALLNHGGVN